MHTLKNNFWRRLTARITHSFPYRRHSSPETERIIAELGNANEMLEAEQQQLRGKLEAVKTEDSTRLAALEQHGREEESKTQDRFATQEQQLNELVADRSRLYERLEALESATEKATNRLEANQRKVTELHGEIELHARELESSRSRTGARLDTIDSQLGELAEKGRLYLQIGRETQSELHNQGVRLGWTSMAVAMAIILATVSGAILIWEAQKNARLMTIMSDSIEQLLATMDRHLNSVHRDMDGASPKTSANGVSTGAADATATHGPAGRPETGMTAEEKGRGPGNSEAGTYVSGGAAVAVERRPEQDAVSQDVKSNALQPEPRITHEFRRLEGDLEYRIVTTGGGRSPAMADRVMVNYLGVGSDGKVIDDTYSSGLPASFYMSELPSALREVLLTMGEGAELEVYAPEPQSGGDTLARQGMRPDGRVTYLIELVEILEDTGTGLVDSVD